MLSVLPRILRCALACTLLSVATAQAAPLMDPVLSVGDLYYVGAISDGTPSSEAFEASYVDQLVQVAAGDTGSFDYGMPRGVQNFDRTASTLAGSLPATVDGDWLRSDLGVTPPVLAGQAFQYALGKYGRGVSHVWFYGDGFTGGIGVPAVSPIGTGLSHVTFFNRVEIDDTPVPEPASLGGLALLGLRLRRRSGSIFPS